MTGYQAFLDDVHVRAAVRTALRARGFTITHARVARAVDARRKIGLHLREYGFPERFPSFLSPANIRSVAHMDPFLWEHLPDMAGFGYQQALVLGAHAVEEDVATLSAAFSAGIALMDYLVDEHEAPVFEFVTPEIVRGMFAEDVRAEDTLERASEGVSDPRVRFLLVLVATCADGFRDLHRRSANDAAWANLREAVIRLYEAERAVTVPAAAPVHRADLLQAVEDKSVLPFVVVDRIVALAGRHTPPRSERASVALGKAIALADNLVDLAKDHHRGAANPLLLELAEILADRDCVSPTDADVYELVDDAVARLCTLIAPGAGGPGEDQVLEFARATVAYWVGWNTEPAARFQVVPTPASLDRGPPEAATRMLLAQQRDGYHEAVHHLRVPRLAPNGVRIEAADAVLFQRAIALDALLDAYAWGFPVPRRVLDAEAWMILGAKRRDAPGGWSYIPEIRELPPDADDLAMVLRVLVRVGGAELAAACNEPIDLALAAADPEGGIPTWIVGAAPESELDATMREYVALTESGGIHPDVVANLISALILYDEPRHRRAVELAVAYLESAQDRRGAWASRWYAGPYYGTYRAVSALALAAPSSPALDRAGAFLLALQRDDGGWGDDASDPLSTALAVAAIVRCREAAGSDVALGEGVAYLTDAQESDGGWPASAFISFPRSDGAAMHTYGSRTITTAFCLQALLAREKSSQASAR